MNLKSHLTAMIQVAAKAMSNLNAKFALAPSTHLMFLCPNAKLANPLGRNEKSF